MSDRPQDSEREQTQKTPKGYEIPVPKREDLKADVLEGHLSSALCHLGNISYRLGRPTPFEPRTRALNGDAEGNDTIAIRSMAYLPLTYDHRLIDGADAGRFLTTIKQRLEEGNFEDELGL